MALLFFRLYRCIVIAIAAFSGFALFACWWHTRHSWPPTEEIRDFVSQAMGAACFAQLATVLVGAFVSLVSVLADFERRKEVIAWNLVAIITCILFFFFSAAVSGGR